MKIQFRNYQPQDFNPLKEIIRKTWHYDDFCSPKTASQLAEVFLSTCLTNQTYSQVAVHNGEPIGIILVKNIHTHRCPWRARWRQIKAIAKLYLSSEGRKVTKIFADVDGIDQQLLKNTHKQYEAELSLFAVSSSCRGQGIGKKLFQKALAYMTQQQLNDFYLFTDTSCNYGFYEHQGMVRRCEKQHTFQTNTMNFFIYDYKNKQ